MEQERAGYETCQVTGKSVPYDEIVDLLGYRVCAEGKEEILGRLRRGERLPGELEAPTIMQRFGSLFVDGLLLNLIGGIISFAIIGSFFSNNAPGFDYNGGTKGINTYYLNQGIVTTLTVVMVIAYYAFLHAKNGQSLGKQVGKIKVVTSDGSPLTFKIALFRALYYVGPQLALPVAYFSMLFIPFDFEGLLYVFFTVGLWGLVDVLLAVIDSSQQRSLHDRLAKTRVIAVD
jgi:uncharacterized RDD family membrane protein YckC